MWSQKSSNCSGETSFFVYANLNDTNARQKSLLVPVTDSCKYIVTTTETFTPVDPTEFIADVREERGFNITIPEYVSTSFESIVGYSCTEGSGVIFAEGSSGVAPYTYEIIASSIPSNIGRTSTDGIFTNTDEGTYTVRNKRYDNRRIISRTSNRELVSNCNVHDYTFTVTNTGNVAISNVVVSDPLLGWCELRVPASGDTDGDGELDLTESWVYTASYSIIQSDIDAGQVNNLATVTEVWTYIASYNIIQDDIDNGQVSNLATVIGEDPEGRTVTDTSTDPTPCATSELRYAEISPPTPNFVPPKIRATATKYICDIKSLNLSINSYKNNTDYGKCYSPPILHADFFFKNKNTYVSTLYLEKSLKITKIKLENSGISVYSLRKNRILITIVLYAFKRSKKHFSYRTRSLISRRKKITSIASNQLIKGGYLFFEVNQYLGKETEQLLKDDKFSEIELRKDMFGFGTLEEFFEMLTWGQLGLHQYPIGILNTNGFYSELMTMLAKMVDQASLHNADQIAKFDIREGDTVYVEKGGEIIPKIIGVDFNKRPQHSSPTKYIDHCPECHTEMSDKIKFEIEFVIQSSPQMLYQYLSTPSGLSEWFADNVNSRGEIFIFIWDGSEEEAKLLKRKSDEFVKFAWEENDDDSYFEMKIIVDEITKDVSLFITDFADEDEVDEAKMLWENQVGDLKQQLGSK
ncbi:DNA ligase [Nymphon striatum]|nr:DNA ligase [Nymphon striatum]